MTDSTTPAVSKPARILSEEMRTAWTAALRSGEYEQGVGQLCNNGKYCCLGVLQALYPDITADIDGDREVYLCDVVLMAVQQLLARINDSCQYKDQDIANSVINFTNVKLNNIGYPGVAGNTFSNLADWIDENL